jgi:hypothetical protein
VNLSLVSAPCALALLSLASCQLSLVPDGENDSDCQYPNPPPPAQPNNVAGTLGASASPLNVIAQTNGETLTLSLSPTGDDGACVTFDMTATLNGNSMTLSPQGGVLVQGQCNDADCCEPSTYKCQIPVFSAPFDPRAASDQWNFVVSDASGSFEVDLHSPTQTVSLGKSSPLTPGEVVDFRTPAYIADVVLATEGGDVIAHLPSSIATAEVTLPSFGAGAQIGGALVSCDVAIDRLPCSAVFRGELETSQNDAIVSKCDFETCTGSVPTPFDLPIVLTFSDVADAGSSDASDGGS